LQAPAPRHERAPDLRRRLVTITWVGDMSLSADLGLPPLDDGGPLKAVRRQLVDSDLTLGNLEGTLGSGGGSKCGRDSEDCFAFQAPARYASMYADAGFDVLNVANNHAADYGPRGAAKTLAALYRTGIGHAGSPGHVELLTVRGVRVALLGFAPYPWAASLRDVPAAADLVRRADREADVVVAMMHAGAEGADQVSTPSGRESAFGEDRGNTRRFAHAAVDAGADLVIGSGPHVVRGVERYRDRLIAYSLGNFLGFNTFGRGGVLSLSGILRVRLDGTGATRGARWTSVRLVGAGTPEVDPSHESAKLVTQVSREDFGPRAMRVEDGTRLVPVSGG
ncbi:MAG TPA: CapA family protein, partial [Thermoleophilaceae bacterium]|nr:CapA family protein [Thermoleophilaceae bacterium]